MNWEPAGSKANRRHTGRVTPLQRYIAEEIATDHVDGLLSRREALRRLGLLGIGATAATALIADCGEKRPAQQPEASASAGASTTEAPATPAGPAPGMDTALPTEPITWAGPRGQLRSEERRVGKECRL